MLVIMDMSTGKIDEYVAPQFGSFEDAVQNAEWLRPGVQLKLGLELGLQPVVHHDRGPSEAEAEAYLRSIYRSQE